MTGKQEVHPSSVLRAAIVDSSTATLIPDLSTIPLLPRYLPGETAVRSEAASV